MDTVVTITSEHSRKNKDLLRNSGSIVFDAYIVFFLIGTVDTVNLVANIPPACLLPRKLAK